MGKEMANLEFPELNQISLFLSSFNNMFSVSDVLFEPAVKSNHVVKVLENASDYLQKGERLVSLAREVFKRELKKIELSDMEKAIYSIEIKSEDDIFDIIRKISRKVVRPLLRSMEHDNDDYAKLLLSMIHEQFHVSLSMPSEPACDITYVISNPKNWEKNERMVNLIIEEEGYAPIVIWGTKLAVHQKNRKNVMFKKSSYTVADIGEVISFLIIISEILREVRRIPENPDTDLIHNRFKALEKEYREQFFTLNPIKYIDAKQTPLDKTYCLWSKKQIHQFTPLLKRYFTKKGVNIVTVRNRAEIDRKREFLSSRDGEYANLPIAMYRTYCEYLFPLYFLDIKDMHYHDFLPLSNTNEYFAFFSTYVRGHRSIFSMVAEQFACIWEEKTQQVRTLNYLNTLTSDYAKSYQQKKNIPEKVIAAMQESYFNKYFGFVEYDESVDLDKMKEVMDEFIATYETYLSFVDSTKNAIRFRKLGHHRASGLYYPSQKCLCVDIRTPSSLIHEYGHLIDYEYGRLSNEYSFSHIRELYKSHLESVAEADSAISGILNGNTKYNLAYYLEPTEIFARSFELYLAKVKGVCNSLLPENFNFAYPQDANFIEHITFYFDNILASIAMQNRRGTA